MLFDMLVELELAEMGFQDPIVATQHQATLRERYKDEIEACINRAIPKEAIECAKQAKSTEQLSHDCLSH